MTTLRGNAAIRRRDECERVSASQVTNGDPADMYATPEGNTGEYRTEYGCIPLWREYTPAEVATRHAAPLGRHVL